MAADKKAIDLGKIKRYIKNRTAEFYISTLNDREKETFKSTINYLNNVRRTKDLTQKYDGAEIERIKNLLTNFSPTREQYQYIRTINRQKRDENTKIRKAKKKAADRLATPQQTEKTTFEKISIVFWELKTVMEEEGKNLNSKELEAIKKNMNILTNFVGVILQERVKFEIQQARKEAEELKAKIERLSNKIQSTVNNIK